MKPGNSFLSDTVTAYGQTCPSEIAARATPSKLSSIERCLLNFEGKHAPDTFALVKGMSFDSCQEAYGQYKLFAWENGAHYQLMHKIVCWCQGRTNVIMYTWRRGHLRQDICEDLYNMAFGIFVCVNNHRESTIFEAYLCMKRFMWAFSKFVEVMDGKSTITILTAILCRLMPDNGKRSQEHTAKYEALLVQMTCFKVCQ